MKAKTTVYYIDITLLSSAPFSVDVVEGGLLLTLEE
jgi:hypothetical protein